MLDIEYLIIGWLGCACFVAFAARRAGRRPAQWFLIGLALPLISIPLVLMSGRPGPRKSDKIIPLSPRRRKNLSRPRRCCGRFISDCAGCPYFRGPKLFGDQSELEAGFCDYFKRTLWKDDQHEERT